MKARIRNVVDLPSGYLGIDCDLIDGDPSPIMGLRLWIKNEWKVFECSFGSDRFSPYEIILFVSPKKQCTLEQLRNAIVVGEVVECELMSTPMIDWREIMGPKATAEEKQQLRRAAEARSRAIKSLERRRSKKK